MCTLLNDLISNPMTLASPVPEIQPLILNNNHPALPGFAAGAHWVELVPEAEPVEEPINLSNFHQPTVSAEDAPYLPLKYNYPDKFD
jgi:hypothetical protein